ncbi:AIPR family protein [Methylobacterium sp. A52T]
MDPISTALMREFVTLNGLDELDEAKQFEHFSTFAVISSRFSDDFDTEDLVTGGISDLGIDAFAVIVNGRIIDDADGVTDLLDLNGYLDVEFVFIQAKRSSHFEGSALLALGDNLRNAIFNDEPGLPVSDDIKRLIEIRRRVYDSAARLRGNPECRIFYVTTGHWNNDEYLVSIINRKTRDLMETNLFKDVKYTPVGAQQLHELYRDTKSSVSREITFGRFVVLPAINNVRASYLGVLPATEYIKLITDEDGNILKSVFIDNVRDFQGENPVNIGITNTITGGSVDQFALRNNGVTIVSRQISTTGDVFTLRDYQVVNGCQTSHVLYAQQQSLTASLLIPVKLIHTDDEEITQEVIKSTNRQTPIDENDLLALTQFQRNLEDYYGGFPKEQRLYYERRSKQYAGQIDVEKSRIVPVGMQLKYFASMFLDAAYQAGRYQGTLLASVRDRVFKSEHRPEPYYTASLAFYRFDSLLKKLVGEERKLRSFKFHLLNAFRYRYELSALPPVGDRRIAAYCAHLNEILWDQERCRTAFEVCADIIRKSAASRSIPLVRDAAKTRDLSEEVKARAMAENPRNVVNT